MVQHRRRRGSCRRAGQAVRPAARAAPAGPPAPGSAAARPAPGTGTWAPAAGRGCAPSRRARRAPARRRRRPRGAAGPSRAAAARTTPRRRLSARSTGWPSTTSTRTTGHPARDDVRREVRVGAHVTILPQDTDAPDRLLPPESPGQQHAGRRSPSSTKPEQPLARRGAARDERQLAVTRSTSQVTRSAAANDGCLRRASQAAHASSRSPVRASNRLRLATPVRTA